MRQDVRKAWRRSLHWWGRLAVWALLCGGSMAWAEGEPLSATLEVHGSGRSGAPRAATVTLLWNGTSLLEGDLEIAIMDGRSVLSRSVVADLALAPGAQTFGLLLPAVGQGTLAIEVREGDPVAGDLAVVDHPGTRAELTAERAFLSRLEGDCSVPLAALAERASPDRVVLRGLVASPDGQRVVRASAEAAVADAALAGSRVADEVLRGGAASILQAIRAEAIG